MYLREGCPNNSNTSEDTSEFTSFPPSGRGGGGHRSLALLLLLFFLLLMQMKSDAVPVLQPPLGTCWQSSGGELAERAGL